MTRSLLFAGLLFAVACDDGGAPSTASGEKKAEAATKTEAKTDKTEAKAAPGKAYAAPKDICALPDLSLLGDRVGKPLDGSPEKETGTFTTEGCVFDLAADVVNTFKLFVAVDGDAGGRFALTDEAMKGAAAAGFVTETVDGLGSEAMYAVQLSAEDKRINATLAVHDGDLFVEARLIAGGSDAWDGADVRKRLIELVRGVMGKL